MEVRAESSVNDSVLMWSHYASNHTGFCIEHNFRELGPTHPLIRQLHPVIYSDKPFDATPYYRQILLNRDFNTLYGIYACVTKSKKSEYEYEWRIVNPIGPDQPVANQQLRTPTPKAVYLGAKIRKDNKKSILYITANGDTCLSNAARLVCVPNGPNTN
jgi:hypothetical protein